MHASGIDFVRQQKLIATLLEPGRYPHAVAAVQVIETHISWVLLAGDYAYKIKKALALGFLDDTRLDTRRHCCEEEIRLNRRTAPDLYLEVVAIGGSPQNPVLGVQPAIEYAVKMRNFAASPLLDKQSQAGKLLPQHIDKLAATLARFHERLPMADAKSGFGSAAAVHAVVRQNLEQLRAHLTGAADREGVASLEAATEAEYAGCRELIEMRRVQGRVRECHGDLHLGNIVLIDDEPVPFDCIDFDPALRWIDVMDEVAFTVMDLLQHERPDFAWRLLNAWLEANGDYEGIPLLRYYLAYRAAVRAKVCAIRAGQTHLPAHARAEALSASRRYLALAQRCLEMYRPALIVTHGLPGSGKTTFSQMMLEQTGAIRLRSDVERKRLFGLGALESSHADIYSRDATRRTYARLYGLARKLLEAGFTVIVDAAFLQREEREAFRELANSVAVPYAIASLSAADAALHERIRQRSNDASEADAAVLAMLRSVQQPLAHHELEYTASFTTEQAPDSKANSQAWDKLAKLLAFA